jgi:hypothetical protein
LVKNSETEISRWRAPISAAETVSLVAPASAAPFFSIGLDIVCGYSPFVVTHRDREILESDISNSKIPDVAQPICHWNAPRNAIRSAAADQMFPRTFMVRWLNYTRVDIFLNSFVW